MTSAQITYVIIGNGIAGITAAEVLRAKDPHGSITMIANDPFPVYYRPALKDYLAGNMSEEKLWARPSSFYQEQRVGFIPGRVVSIDARQHFVQLHSGHQIGYRSLLLAPGAQAMPLTCPGVNLAGVSTLRTVADYQTILRDLNMVKRAVICGSGTLALESAEVLNKQGCQVTHLLRSATLWSDVIDPAASDLVLNEERRAGIDVRIKEEIAEITGKEGRVSGITTKSGTRISCELVLVAIGIQPNIDFIQGNGIASQRGIFVDDYMRTSAPDIYAAGDVIETINEMTGQKRLLGQWYPAIQQARIAAHNMTQSHASGALTQNRAYHYYNASFLYGLDFVAIGPVRVPKTQTPDRYQEIVAPAQPRNYRKVLLKQGIAMGALFLGDRHQALAFKRAIDHQVDISSVSTRIFEEDFNLAAWLDEQHVTPATLSLQDISPTQAPFPTTRQASTFASSTVQLPAVTTNKARDQEAQEALLIPVPHPKVTVTLREFVLQPDDTMTIGRSNSASLPIDHRSVSRNHVEITCYNGSYMVRDMGSSNGTFVNNTRLSAGTDYALHQNDHLRMGDVQFRFEWCQSALQHIPGTPLSTSAARRIPEQVLASLPSTPALVVIGQEQTPAIFPLQAKHIVTIGRNQSNLLSLNDLATSQMHAELFPTAAGFYVRDLNSRNGTFVNKIKINNPYRLFHGDSIVIGNMLLYYSAPPTLTESMNQTTTLRQPVVNPNSLMPVALPVAGLSHRSEVRPLNRERIRFEIDMCIGCDRCMVACPLPLSSTVTITDLNQATVTKKISPQVAQFTQACIMCGSCVPVCPVDNHRDLLMLSLKQRQGTSWEETVNAQHIMEQLPRGWTLQQLMQLLRLQPALKNPQQVSDNYLLHLAASSYILQLPVGETVIQEGAYGRDLYFILDGRLALFALDSTQTEFPVAVLNRGEHVGEDGLLTGQIYNATARVQTPAVVLQVPEQVMQQLMELVPQVGMFFNHINNTRSLRSILKRMALFQDVEDSDINTLIQQAQVKRYDRDESLFAEKNSLSGQRPARETLHIILEGFVKVARALPTEHGASAERVMAYRQAGDYFAGGLDLLGDGKAVTVTTINRVRVAEIPRNTILALFQRYPEVKQRFTDRLREYVTTATLTHDEQTPTSSKKSRTAHRLPVLSVQTGLHSLVSQGVVEGTEVLVIDLDKCIHCDECEEACERRHGHSRMNRKGKVIGNISITTTCRQCQDPVCMLCSRAGIARRPNGEVYITESCIGCGICAERCPYGAISIVDAEGETGSQRAQQITGASDENASCSRFNSFFSKGSTGKTRARHRLPVMQGSPVAPGPLEHPGRDAANELRKKVAIKCDLCAGYNNQACVQACPTGAAIRIQPAKFFGTTEEILLNERK